MNIIENDFKLECKKWIDIFELNDWKIDFVFDQKKDNPTTTWASIISLKPKIATIYLKYDLEKDINKEWIGIHAKREILHILIGKLATLGAKRFVNQNEFYTAKEHLVVKLMNIIK